MKDAAGRRLFGGYSFRVSGSRFWTLRGLEVFKVEIFAGADIPLPMTTGEVAARSAAASHGCLSPSSSGRFEK